MGVSRGANWGSGDRDFIYKLLQECLNGGNDKKERGGKNFFNDYLEHLFYDTLNKRDRGNSSPTGDQSYSPYFNCRIPFLNGGLFEQAYDWKSTFIDIDNQIFIDIIGTFNRYNFTVHESTPLETEVAVDPEILGRVFEKLQILKEQKEKGSFYTPANIVHYMSRKTIVQYLTDNSDVSKEELERFIVLKDEIFANKTQIAEIEKLIPNIEKYATQLNKLLNDVKIIDPAVGSGAFPMGLLNEITGLRRFLNERYIKETNQFRNLLSEYDIKKQVLENSIYGVDLDPSAVEIARLRFWLSLVVEYDLEEIKPLPNLDYKLVCGDSLRKLPFVNSSKLKNELDVISVMRESYFSKDDVEEKHKLKKVISEFLENIYDGQVRNLGYRVSHDYRLAFSEVFQGDNPGFDIVIANPPYVSTKGVDVEYKKTLKSNMQFGFADDLYYHFFIKGLEIAKKGGVLCYITSDTFLTTVTKKNLRRKLESKEIIEVIKTSNVFENAMVSPAITVIKNCNVEQSYDLVVKDAVGDFDKPKIYSTSISTFRDAVNHVIFLPTNYNMRLYNSFNSKVSELMDTWWDRIKTSSDISKHRTLINNYIDKLKPGDLTLLGIITDGGVGLQTGNNGKYIGVREGTKEAADIYNASRAKKLIEAKDLKKNAVFNFASKHEAQDFLNSKTELEIWKIFDDAKLKYGRDVFGQGYLFRIIPNNMLADVNTLTDDEKKNGISGTQTFVPYDKGDKGGNRWYLETPFLIDWSKQNVKELTTSAASRFQNSQFYFKDGFCWNNVLQPTQKEGKYIKARIKDKSVHDVASMSMVTTTTVVPVFYAVLLLNSSLFYNYLKSFINLSVNLQMNDFRQFPIIVPNGNQLARSKKIYDKAVDYMKRKYEINSKLTDEFWQIQKEVDMLVEEMYIGEQND